MTTLTSTAAATAATATVAAGAGAAAAGDPGVTGEEETIVTTIESPIGPLTLTASGGRLTGLAMQEQRHPPALRPEWRRDDAWFKPLVAQVSAYFAGELRSFEIPLAMRGTEFQRSVWAGLQEIPYGDTISYGELARRVGRPKAVRAVGLANGRNPIAVVVPCHRVIGADGTLTGYGGGLDRKAWLLTHEAAHRR